MWDLQRIVYAIEVGGLRKFIFGGVVFAVMLALAAYYSVTQFNGLNSAEAMDQAQLGRNLAEGRGFSTWFIRPLAIWQMREYGVADKQIDLTAFPDTVNPPAYPMLLGLVFKVFSPKFVISPEDLKSFQFFDGERYILLVGIGCTLLTGILLFLWIWRTFDLLAAVTGVILFMLTDLVWQFAISGLSTTFAMMLVCGLGLLLNEALLAEEERHSWRPVLWMGLGGFLAGLLILTRYSYVWTLVPCALLIFFSFRMKWVILPVFFAVVLVVTGWWWARNIQVSGNPFGLAWAHMFTNSGRFTGGGMWRSLAFDGEIFGLRSLIRSVVYGISGQLTTLSNLCGGFLILGLAVGSLFHVFRSFVAGRSCWFWMGTIVLFFVASGASFRINDPDMWNETNQIFPFLPVLICFGSAFFLVLLDRIQFPVRLLKYLAIVAVCLVQAIPIGLRIAGTTPKFPYPPYFPPVLLVTANWLGEKEVQMSDIPWASAWYQGKSTVWLPMKRDDFFTINDLIHPVCIILLTPYSSNSRFYSEIKAGEYEEWSGMVSRTDFSKSPLPVPLPLWPKDKWDYFMFADRQRSGM